MTRSADGPGDGVPAAGSPYPGLAAYGDSDEDAELFFGRAPERDLIVANLRAARLTVLYGPSGVGKSSLLRAGVVHRLRAMAGDGTGPADATGDPRSPVVILDDWAGDAAARLTTAIRAAAGDGDGNGAGDGTAASDAPLADTLVGLRSRGGGAPLIILDQFEEYLRLHPEPVEGGFDEVLSDLLTQPDVLVRVLIAVRDDRLAGLDRFEGRVPNLLSNFLRLGPLTREAAREAILGPVERHNAWLARIGARGPIVLEPGLADKVLDELVEFAHEPFAVGGTNPEAGGSERGTIAAPVGPRSAGGEATHIEPAVLQLTMRRLWDADITPGGTTLRLATLAALGGAGRIFATHLDVEMAALPAADRRLAAEMFRFLVTPSGVMRSYSAADLSAYVRRPEGAVEALAEKLSRAPARILRALAPAAPGSRVEYELFHQVLARPALDWRSRFQTARLERRAQHLLLGLVAMSALALALVGYAVQPGPLRRLELSTVDQRFALQGAQRPDRNIVLVTVDDSAYGPFLASSRPPRATIAAALDAIGSAQPRVIACDIIFTGARESPAVNAALSQAIERQRKHLVMATDELNADGQTELLGQVAETFSDHTAPAAGYAGFPADPSERSSVVRKMQRSVALPTQGAKPMSVLAVATARLAGRLRASLTSLPTSAWIAFRGGAGTFPSVSLDDVLRRDGTALSRLRDRIVVLGITAKASGDVHETSAPGRGLISGPEIQANAISTALRSFPLRDGGRGLDVALIVLLALVPLALGLLLSVPRYVLGVVVAAALFCAGAQLAFDSGRVISVVFPLISLVLSAAGVLAVLLLRARAPMRSGSARGG
jgi:CHASE2 domain-containing sensor protein